jgi:ribosome-associated toxin RatA of RatAB toxin-antitoxin module
MKHFFASSIFLIVFMHHSAALSQAYVWQLEKDVDGIKVFTRNVDGYQIKEFKATTKIDAPLATVFDILLDVNNYPGWIEDVIYAEKIFQDKYETGMYYQLKLPWPIKNRDLSLVSRYKQLPDKSIHFELSNLPEVVEEKDGFMRMHKVAGQWHIAAIDDHTTVATYQFLADPEGFLPGWVVNMFIIDGPFKTLQNLKEYAKSK